LSILLASVENCTRFNFVFELYFSKGESFIIEGEDDEDDGDISGFFNDKLCVGKKKDVERVIDTIRVMSISDIGKKANILK
jgi:hypothetical protein